MEKSGTLKTSKKDLEDNFRNIHLDPKRHEHLVIPSKIPPIVPPEHQCDGGPPTGKEVERAVRWERTASATGPNGIPYKVYKNSTDVLRFLWRMMKTERKKKNMSWSQKRKRQKTSEGKIFFSVIAQRISRYLLNNRYIDTSVQMQSISGFPGCLEQSSKEDLHVVFLDLANVFGLVPHELLWVAFKFFSIPDNITSLVKSYF